MIITQMLTMIICPMIIQIIISRPVLRENHGGMRLRIGKSSHGTLSVAVLSGRIVHCTGGGKIMANRTRPKQIVIRVSEEELAQIKEKVEQSGKSQQTVYHRSTYTVENCQSGRIERDIPRAEKTRKQSEPDSQEAE